MFWHLYKYRLKSLINSREEVFWNILFPLFLATCFSVAFSAIGTKAYDFHSIPVAIVYESENDAFQQTIEAISKDDSQGDPFLTITEGTAAKATSLLADGDVDAIITVNDSIEVTVAKSGLNQTAVQSFVSQYLQQASVIQDIMANHPESLDQVLKAMTQSNTYITSSSITDSDVDPLTGYYLSLIGMTALFGGFFGIQCANQLKADLSPVGMRKCISPAHRGKMILAEFAATYTLHVTSLFILLLYMISILQINLGDQFGYIALTCGIGSLVGISSGIFIGSLPKVKEGGKIAIFLIYSLGSSFLSGLMVSDIKNMLQHSAPLVNKLNPGTVIQDSLYSLLIYNTHDRYFSNMIILTIYAVSLCLISYFITRRESYASL